MAARLPENAADEPELSRFRTAHRRPRVEDPGPAPDQNRSGGQHRRRAALAAGQAAPAHRADLSRPLPVATLAPGAPPRPDVPQPLPTVNMHRLQEHDRRPTLIRILATFRSRGNRHKY